MLRWIFSTLSRLAQPEENDADPWLRDMRQAERYLDAGKLDKAEAKLDWTQPAEVLARKVRAFNPWPVAEAQVAGERLRIHGAVAVEDAEAVAGQRAHEAAFFHLHNLVTQAGHLLVTAARPPRDWGLTLPDLASRLQAAPLTRLDPPDDALLSAVLIKLFADRQITVAPALIPYLASRMDRSFAAARNLVARLDALALAEGRPVTRALAATLLDRPESDL